MAETMNRMKAIRTFFEMDGGRKITMDEMKALTVDDRKELADMAAKEMGVELVDSK